MPERQGGAFDRATYEIAHVENALFDGFPEKGTNQQKGAAFEASMRLRIPRPTFRDRLSSYARKGIEPDWSMYRDKPLDLVAERRERNERADLLARIKALESELIAAQDVRAGVLKLTGEPLKPKLVIPGKDAGAKGRTVVLHLSDIQYGETVLAEEMDGLNVYSSEIAARRLGRFFHKAAELMTRYWKGDPPDEIVLLLGGDMLSGDIHGELSITNFPRVPVAVRECAEHIAGGIQYLHKSVRVPLRVYTVPGNHGRLTVKPHSKGRAANNLDLLVTDFVEATLKGTKTDEVVFYHSASPDAFFSIYGWHVLLNHGDTMGGRGAGTGFIGPMATIVKGHRKLVDTSWRTGRPVHAVFTGHFHTTGKTAFGWANGSVVGFNEFARDLRADPEPARQNMVVFHPRHGVIAEQPLYLGAPDEGSLYAGPASVVRPQWEGGL